MKANSDHFFRAFELCLANKFSHAQAIVMSKGFALRGLIDASDGCAHYALRMLAAYINDHVPTDMG